MMPAFVVPDVQTTAAMFGASLGTASRTVSAVSRWSGVSTTSASISSSRNVLTIDECASEPTTTRSRPLAPRLFAVSRATARADRLPAEPPDTKHPPEVVGSPASCAITRSTLFSAAIAPDASSHEMPWIDAQETNMSNTRLAFVGAAGMKPRKRGLSAEITLGAITDVYTPSTSSGGRGVSRITPSRRSYSSSARKHALVERHGIHPQSVLGVREHAAHHVLGVLVDLVHG